METKTSSPQPDKQADAPTLAANSDLLGVDRRAFLMRSAVLSAAAVITGRALTPEARAAAVAAPAPKAPPLASSLNVVQRSKGPVMTTLEEFKVGPGPSSSHTIGPMRITYDFYQRCTKLPADKINKATAMKVHLFGSLSSTGKGHGTERASLAGIVGKEPATVEPAFLDGLAANPGQAFPVKLGEKTLHRTARARKRPVLRSSPSRSVGSSDAHFWVSCRTASAAGSR